jgi:hypothetical protein
MKRFCAFVFVLLSATCSAATLNVPAQYATVQAAINAAVAGDTVLLASGTYAEQLLTVRSGTALNRIVIDGQNPATTIVHRFEFKHSYITLKNVTVKGYNQRWGALVWMSRGGHFWRLENVTVDNNLVAEMYGINWDSPTTYPFGTDAASDGVMTGCTIQNTVGYPMMSICGDRNIIEYNFLLNGWEVDNFRLFGRENVIRYNVCDGNYDTVVSGNHPDFLQTFGNNGLGSRDHEIHHNIVLNAPVGALTQLEGNLVEDIGYWSIHHNVFVDVGLGSSNSIPGIAWDHNTFYRGSWVNGGHALPFGERWYEHTSVHFTQSEDATLAVQVASGNIIDEVDKNYMVRVSAVGANFTVDTGADTINDVSHGRVNTDSVRFSVSTGGTLPAPLTTGTWYIINKTNDTFQVSATPGGAAVDITTAGTGTFTWTLNGALYYNGDPYQEGDDFFGVPGVTTYTESSPSLINLWRRMTNVATDTEISNNIFIEIGDNSAGKGWYGTSRLTDDSDPFVYSTTIFTGFAADYNMVAGPAGVAKTAGIAQYPNVGYDGNKWYEVNGINGGTINFYNTEDPLGPDNLPFTADDGLQLTTGSVAIAADSTGGDLGAYSFSAPDPGTPDPPIAPTGLNATTASHSVINLTWTDASSDETGFHIWRSLTTGTGFALLATVGVGVQSYSDTPLEPSTVYYYKVSAFNDEGDSSLTAEDSATTNAAPARGRRPGKKGQLFR